MEKIESKGREPGSPVSRVATAPDDESKSTVRVRCRLCHESVRAESEPSILCRGCRARHHLACWGHAGACAGCGRTDFLPTTNPTERRGLRWGWLPVLGAGVLGGSVGVVPGVLVWLLGVWLAESCKRDFVGIVVCWGAFPVGVALCAFAGGWAAWRLVQIGRAARR